MMVMVMTVMMMMNYASFPSPPRCHSLPTPVIRACAIAFFLLVVEVSVAFTKGKEGVRSVAVECLAEPSRAGWVVFFMWWKCRRRRGPRHSLATTDGAAPAMVGHLLKVYETAEHRAASRESGSWLRQSPSGYVRSPLRRATSSQCRRHAWPGCDNNACRFQGTLPVFPRYSELIQTTLVPAIAELIVLTIDQGRVETSVLLLQACATPLQLTAAESLHELVAKATAFTLLLRLCLRLRLEARLCLGAAWLSGQVLAAHPLLAGKVGCASRELRRGATRLRRLELRSPFASSAQILGVAVTSSTLLLLLALSGRLWRSASGTRLWKVGIQTLWGDRCLRCAVHVLSAEVSSGGVSALAVPGSSGRSRHVPALAAVELHPVVLAILNFAGVLQRGGEELAEVVVIGLVLEAKVADVGKVLVELFRVAVTEILDGSGLLLLSNLFVLLLVRGSLQALPGETSTEEVHEHMAQGFEVITS